MENIEDDKYASARIDLDDAITAFVEEVQEIGIDNDGIASDVSDSLYNASNGKIRIK